MRILIAAALGAALLAAQPAQAGLLGYYYSENSTFNLLDSALDYEYVPGLNISFKTTYANERVKISFSSQCNFNRNGNTQPSEIALHMSVDGFGATPSNAYLCTSSPSDTVGADMSGTRLFFVVVLRAGSHTLTVDAATTYAPGTSWTLRSVVQSVEN